jgi:hypothetical protein
MVEEYGTSYTDGASLSFPFYTDCINIVGSSQRLEMNDSDFSETERMQLSRVMEYAHAGYSSPIFSMRPPTDDPYYGLELRTPSADDLSRITLWARTSFAARCAQRVLAISLMPQNEAFAEAHHAAVEQAVGFAFDCAEEATIVDLPAFQDIQLPAPNELHDPVVQAAILAALVPFGASDADTALAASDAASSAHWAAKYYNGEATFRESFEFHVKVYAGIWSDFGRLCEASVEEHWSESTPVPPEFYTRGEDTKRPNVFICYAHQDEMKARELFRRLRAAGADPWLDKYNLFLGDEWETEIKKAVLTADVFLVCLRPGFDEIGFRQREVRWAREALELRPPGRGFILPFILEPCPLPDWVKPLHAGTNLSQPTSFNELINSIEKHTGLSMRKR